MLEENTCLNNNFSNVSLNLYCPLYHSYLFVTNERSWKRQGDIFIHWQIVPVFTLLRILATQNAFTQKTVFR